MSRRESTVEQAGGEDRAYQDRALQDVSRTFALTIPQLPGPLATVVGNAYLLCRIADTIEDDPGLEPPSKREFAGRFNRVLVGADTPEAFARDLHARLGEGVLEAERDLILNTPRVVRITHGFRPVQRAALERCVRVMAEGMVEFQLNKTLAGLDDLPHLDRYCYHVAGVVGEMLTELFCDFSQAIARERHRLLPLAVSFGQGLQMTNILKDIWEDRARGACWLPRAVFERHGFDLADLGSGRQQGAFGRGLTELVGIARGHLDNALSYTLMMPASETGIRRFCLWALGMAVLTLRNIHRHPTFTAGGQVKISRSSVRATIAVTNLSVSSDAALRALFDYFTRRLPEPAEGPRALVA